MFHYISRGRFGCFFGIFLVIQNFTVSNLEKVPDDVIPKLYLKYREVVDDGQNVESSRRLIDNDKLYEVHVKKLKEVNAFKIHNLMIKEEVRTNKDPLIYINNPVESKLPYAYLTLEEFKDALTNRIKVQKEELAAKRQLLLEKMNMTQNASTEFVTYKLKKITKLVAKPTKTVKKILSTAITKKTNITTEKKTTKEIIRESTQNILIEKEFSTQKTSIQDMKDRMLSEGIKLDNVTDTPIQRAIENSFRNKELHNVNTTEMKNLTETAHKSTPTQTITDREVKEYENKEITEEETSLKYSETLPSHTVETTTEDIQKENKRTPKRAKVSGISKVREKLSTTSTKRKRSTLGRPLVFMGQ